MRRAAVLLDGAPAHPPSPRHPPLMEPASPDSHLPASSFENGAMKVKFNVSGAEVGWERAGGQGRGAPLPLASLRPPSDLHRPPAGGAAKRSSGQVGRSSCPRRGRLALPPLARALPPRLPCYNRKPCHTAGARLPRTQWRKPSMPRTLRPLRRPLPLMASRFQSSTVTPCRLLTVSQPRIVRLHI